jgi:energy-coupling factor transporter ATP-binding protein EcfA2
MISLIEALNYRSLRYVRQQLSPFQLLIGPNGSGKTTFLDVPSFLAHLVQAGLDAAIGGDDRLSIPLRATDARQLLWKQQGHLFELAVETPIPADLARGNGTASQQVCRYELAIDADAIGIAAENLFLIPPGDEKPRRQLDLFPSPRKPPSTILVKPNAQLPKGWKRVIRRNHSDKATFFAENSNWQNPFKILAGRTALASLPEDPERFPVACWFRAQLIEQMHRLVLSSEHMRLPSPPSRQKGFRVDGSNLPWVVDRLQQNPDRFSQWLAHLQEALPEFRDFSTVLREEDRHRYLTAQAAEDVVLPSWVLSDGTLRLLALTLLAYVEDLSGSYLIEEPENGIHPKAMESVFQSLSSVYDAQILCATHSSVLLSLANPAQLLCFAKTEDGRTDVIQGDQHPVFRDWQRTIDLETLFASGVLG